ncbi:MAG: hypothetical protein CMF55_00510 [Legionellales bacterium]|nr:hypothetical protein [Legionellales bacterium]
MQELLGENIRTMTMKKYGLYMAQMMGRDPQWGEPFMPPAPTNIRDGYEEYAYTFHADEDRAISIPPSFHFISQDGRMDWVREGTDNTPREPVGNAHYTTKFFTHDVEKICDVEFTEELEKWLKGCDTYGFPTVYYG